VERSYRDGKYRKDAKALSQADLRKEMCPASVNFIEAKTSRRKRKWMRTIAAFVSFVFLFQQLGIAEIARPGSSVRSETVAEKLLPSYRESAQASGFAPSWMKRAQAKHEEHISRLNTRQRMMDEFLESPGIGYSEDLPLKKKPPQAGGGAGAPDYTMFNPDESEDPHIMDVPDTPSDPSETMRFDITRMDINKWMQTATREVDEDTGDVYWVGYGEGHDGDDRIIQKLFWKGEGDSRKVDYILTGFRLTDSGDFEAKYRIDHEYAGDDLTRTVKTNLETGMIAEETIFEGTGDDSHAVKTIIYGKDGEIIRRVDNEYDENGALKEARTYDTDSDEEGEGELKNVTYFNGDKGEEITDYSQSISDGDVTQTVVSFYRDGKRASEVSGEEYRYSMSMQITFEGDPDLDGDGVITDEELENAKRISMVVFHDELRLAGEEVADYMVSYGNDEQVLRTTVYFYADGNRASEVNYREPMTSSAVYRGDLDADGDGEISDEELEAGVKVSETFFHTFGRLKGEEKADYSVKYLSDESIHSTTVFWYEDEDGESRASGSETDDAMRRSVTYFGDPDANGDGELSEEELADARKISETFYLGLVNEEKADYTYKYNSREDITTTTVFWYGDDMDRAEDAAADDPMKKSVTYRGEAVADGEIDEDARILSETYYQGAVNKEKADFTLKYSYASGEAEVSNITVFWYIDADGQLVRAVDAADEDPMKKSTTYTADSIAWDEYNDDGTLKDGEDGLIDDPIKTSETFFQGGARDEKADYTIKYDSRGNKTSITIFWYEGPEELLRAEDAAPDDAMKKSVTYTADSIAEDEYNEDGTLKEGEDGLIDDPVKVSETFFRGIAGEEKSDYTVKYDSRGNRTSMTIFWYIAEDELVRAEYAASEDAMKKSVTYSAGSIAGDEFNDDGTIKEGEDGLVDDPIIISVTFFRGEAGEEKTDYSIKYDSMGDETSITIFWYEDHEKGLVRAGEADPDSPLKKSEVYTPGSIDPEDFNEDGTLKEGADGLTDDPTKLSETFFMGAVNEEKSDYSVKYAASGKRISLTVFWYVGPDDELLRAENALTEDPMKKSVTYRAASIEESEFNDDGTIMEGHDGLRSDPVKDSETFFQGAAREEKSDYSIKYSSFGERISFTVFQYLGPSEEIISASEAGPEDPMKKSITYKWSSVAVNEFNDDGRLKDGHDGLIDDPIKESETFFQGNSGEEKSDYTLRYMPDGVGIRNTTYYYYESLDDQTGLPAAVRAQDSYVNDAMLISSSYKGDHFSDPASRLQNETYYYTGFGVGEEISDYSFSYAADGTTINTRTDHFYGEGPDGKGLRAEYLTDPDEAMSRSETYMFLDGTTPTLQTETFYYGIRGEEISDYSFRYGVDGETIRNRTLYFYGGIIDVDGKLGQRAEDVTSTEYAMTRSETYLYLGGEERALQSETYFIGDKGDEIADYSYNYKLFGIGAGTEIKTTSVMYYEDIRASSLTAAAKVIAVKWM